jgi:hypothetical protein
VDIAFVVPLMIFSVLTAVLTAVLTVAAALAVVGVNTDIVHLNVLTVPFLRRLLENVRAI